MSSRTKRRLSIRAPNEEETMPGNRHKLFVNLHVKDLDRSVDFFTKLGLSFDPRFTDKTATCMIVGEDAFVMLLVESKFDEFGRAFGKAGHATPATHPEAFLAIEASSKEDVDVIADKALEIGGSRAGGEMDLGFMYGRSFNDPDGHLWEIFFIDPSQLETSETRETAAAAS
jgi:predicted lactoylglutathione lyase